MGTEAKIKKTLGETDEANQLEEAVDSHYTEGEKHIFTTFVKEKTTLIGYIHDLIKFAAKT